MSEQPEIRRWMIFGSEGWPIEVCLLSDHIAVKEELHHRLAHGGEPDISPGDVIAAEPDGTITLDDGITTWNPSRATAFLLEEKDRRIAELETEAHERITTVCRLLEERDQAEVRLQALLDALTGEEALTMACASLKYRYGRVWGSDMGDAIRAARDAALAAVEKHDGHA